MKKGTMKHHSQSKLSTGFTVVELMVAMAALAIVILIAVPGSSAVIEKYQLRSTSNDLHQGLSLARTESHARSMVVRLCPSSNGHTCRSDGNWNHGWLVYSDGNGDGAVQDIELIRAFEAPPRKIRITAKGAVQSSASFTTAGLMNEGDSPDGEFLICIADSETSAKKVSIDADGWVHAAPVSEQDCRRG